MTGDEKLVAVLGVLAKAVSVFVRIARTDSGVVPIGPLVRVGPQTHAVLRRLAAEGRCDELAQVPEDTGWRFGEAWLLVDGGLGPGWAVVVAPPVLANAQAVQVVRLRLFDPDRFGVPQ